MYFRQNLRLKKNTILTFTTTKAFGLTYYKAHLKKSFKVLKKF